MYTDTAGSLWTIASVPAVDGFG